MLICGFNKTTLLDYPEHVAATIFLGGCNFRCPFCQNRDLILNPSDFASFTEEDVLAHLKKRRSMLTGVCVTGGEPTIYGSDVLENFLSRIKELGYLIKLDTNGTNPEMLRRLYDAQLIDYVAMDIKTGPSDYMKVAGLDPTDNPLSAKSYDKILSFVKESVDFLMNETDPSRFTYEFRTTVVRELHNENSFIEIGNWIKGASRYYLQSYKDSENVLCPGFHAYSKAELEAFADLLRPMIPSVSLRGVD